MAASDVFSRIHGTLATTFETLGIQVGGALSSPPSAAQGILAGGTILLSTTGFTVRVAPVANRTGVILTAGSVDGQCVVVINTSAFTLTMAAAGTSNVANGTACIIPDNGMMLLTWDVATSRWYPGR
jgi:hypothetical protein